MVRMGTILAKTYNDYVCYGHGIGHAQAPRRESNVSTADGFFRPGLGPVHHVGYVVDSIETTVARLAAELGAGPFLAMDDIELQDVTSGGELAEYHHSSAFGQVGGGTIELIELGRLSPDRLVERFAGVRPSLHHVAYAVAPASVERVRRELDERGVPGYLHAHNGDIDFTYHSAPALGHDVEIHSDVDALQGFTAMIVEAAESWDGSVPLRPAFG
jgi:hypothetical protein